MRDWGGGVERERERNYHGLELGERPREKQRCVIETDLRKT